MFCERKCFDTENSHGALVENGVKFCDKIGMIGSAGANAFELLQNMFAKSHWETSERNEQECVEAGQIWQPFWKGVGVGVEFAVNVADSDIT